jgi:hypothetical protein
MSYKKIVAQLKKYPLPTELPYDSVRLVLERCGYSLTENGSSHEPFRKKGCPPISIPRTNGRTVKRKYLEKMVRLIEECLDEEESD